MLTPCHCLPLTRSPTVEPPIHPLFVPTEVTDPSKLLCGSCARPAVPFRNTGS